VKQLSSLQVGDELSDVTLIRLGDDSRLPQITFAFGRFRRQNVAGEGLVTANLAGAGFAKTFGGAAVGLDLGHDPSLFLSV